MKKDSFLGVLLLLGGLLIASFILGVMLKYLHISGGKMFTFVIAPLLLIAQAVGVLCYAPKYGAMKTQKEAGDRNAKHLYNIEWLACVFAILSAIGLIFHAVHWSFCTVLLFSVLALAILSILAGIFSYKYVNKKE